MLTLLALGSLAVATTDIQLFANTQEVTLEGVADITSGEAAARQAAIVNAQKLAVEAVLGVYISSAFSAEQKEVARDNASAFSSQVQEKIVSKSSGFIEKQTIMSERRDGGLYRVTLRCSVRASSLQQEVAGMRALLKSAGYPKIMVAVGERYTNARGESRPIEPPSIAADLEEVLLKKTFDLVAKESGGAVNAATAPADASLAQSAARLGADVVVTGMADVKFSAFNEFNDNLYYVAALVNLRAISAQSGQVLASFAAEGKSAGVSEDTARVKAVAAATPEAADKLLSSLVSVWKQQLEQGKRFHITLNHVRNYGKEGRAFLKAMQALPKVAVTRELGFRGEVLALEVMYKGQKDELVDSIFAQVATQKAFRKLNKTADDGDRIDLSIK